MYPWWQSYKGYEDSLTLRASGGKGKEGTNVSKDCEKK